MQPSGCPGILAFPRRGLRLLRWCAGPFFARARVIMFARGRGGEGGAGKQPGQKAKKRSKAEVRSTLACCCAQGADAAIVGEVAEWAMLQLVTAGTRTG